jgi:hypothetical protein
MLHGSESVVPSTKDLAEFFRLGILNRSFDAAASSPWINGIIGAEVDPPTWAIELAANTADWYQTIALLQSVPGHTSALLPRQMLVALVRRRWLAKKLTGREVTHVVFSLLPDGWESSGHLAGIFQFDHIFFECLDTGHSLITEERADQMLTEFLSYYSAFDHLIPSWIN